MQNWPLQSTRFSYVGLYENMVCEQEAITRNELLQHIFNAARHVNDDTLYKFTHS